MSSTIKNIILFLGIGIVLVVLYVILFKGGKKEEDFSTSVDLGGGVTSPSVPFPDTLPSEKAEIARAFLSDLLNIRTIGLDSDIFSDITFSSLRDAGVVLIQDGREGRPNPFAPIGVDIVPTAELPLGASATTSASSVSTTPSGNTTSTTTTPTKTPVKTGASGNQ